MSGSTSKRYPAELRERAVRMVAEIQLEHDSEWVAMSKVAGLLGVGTVETVRKWCRQAQVDAGTRRGVTFEESAELRRLKRENAELKRANAILKSASESALAESVNGLRSPPDPSTGWSLKLEGLRTHRGDSVTAARVFAPGRQGR